MRQPSRDFISREAAINVFGVEADILHHGETKTVRDKINAIPAADVAPVVRSRIVNVCEHNDIRFDSDGEPHNNLYTMGECENCGCEMFPEWKGCPVCLARMNGGEPHD